MATIATFAAFSSRGYGFGGNNPVFPTGGDYIYDDIVNDRRVHFFLNSGNFKIPDSVKSSIGKFVQARVLVVGAGGGAGESPAFSGGGGGGGGGGSVVYDNSYQLVKGKEFSVVVGSAGGKNSNGGTSYFEGLPPAGGGGAGGSEYEFSMGGSAGGPGGGGSWVNGTPGGPNFSVANPGVRWGSVNPAAPGTYTFVTSDLTPTFFPAGSGQPSLAPLPSPNSSIVDKRWKGDAFGYNNTSGNGNYGASTAAPNATNGAGLASTGYYSSNGFRARGGGGTGASGGYGGQGVLTDFIDKEDGVNWRWILGGGSGWIPGTADGYDSLRTVPGAYVWRDSGVKSDGTYLSNTFVQGVSVDRWSTERTTLQDNPHMRSPWGSNGGYSAGGGGAGWPDRGSSGKDGIVIIRYDLNAFPGGSPSASANVFGGTISTSANGRFRYHTWIGNVDEGTSSNSQTWYISDSYRPRRTDESFRDGEYEPPQWGQITTQYGGTSAANTEPFYYNGDLPTFYYDMLVIGGGGSAGIYSSDSVEPAFMPGGGGSGGINYQSQIASRGLPSVATTLSNIDVSDLYRYSNSGSNIETNDNDWGKLTSSAMDLRPGFIRAYPNSHLNNRWESRQLAYVQSGVNPPTYYDPSNPLANSRERNFRIKPRGGNVKKPGVVRRSYFTDLPDNFFGDNSVGNGTSSDSRRFYYIFASSMDNGGVPSQDGAGWGESMSVTDYDKYFYDGYTKVRIGRYSSLDEPGQIAKVNGNDSGDGNENNKSFTLGTWTGVQDIGYGHERFAAGVVTGTHPSTGESYYNCIRIDAPLTKYQNPRGNDASQGGNFFSSNYFWSKFWTKVNNFGFNNGNNIWDASTGGSQNSPNVWDHGYRTGMVQGLVNVDPTNNRTMRFLQEDDGSYGSYSNNAISLTGGGDTRRKGRFTAIYAIQQGDNVSTRKFQEINTDSNEINVNVPAGWKIVDTNQTNGSQMAWINTETYFGGNRDDQTRSRVQVYRKILRRIVVDRFVVQDIQVGAGGWGDRSSPRGRRNGGTSSVHPAELNSPPATYRSYGGGAGGNKDQFRGVGRDDGGLPSTSAIGSAGGSAFLFDSNEASDPYPQNSFGFGQPSVSSSANIVAYAGGGVGGGSVDTRDITLKFGGATRGAFNFGKSSTQALIDLDGTNMTATTPYHGGRGFFGYSSAPEATWYYYKDSQGQDGTQQFYSGTTYYYYVKMNQYPYNAGFGAGGGGGATTSGGNGSSANGGKGGDGGSGFTSNITGFSTVYSHGGGGAGRFLNGSPGNSQPANPADQSVPAGAPVADHFKPFGGGGGISAGSEEGLGPIPGNDSSRLYHPGSGPWPTASPVGFGTAHMDTLRWKFASVPAAQKGDPGTAYAGKQGVVIISYNRSQFL